MQNQLIGNRYRIKGLIGEGGMASVYAALDEKLDRRVAIKILHQHLARNPDIRERFLLEARTVSSLNHPNIAKVYDFSGLDAERLWMISEILYGVDLAGYVQNYPKYRLHPVVAALITREVCSALYEVHKLNIVHRDIKPENIMMLDSGQVKLMDFGIAKVHRAKATQTGTFMGSPSYMSPEQIRGVDVDVRADIYSLSVLFYEIVAGVLPYSGQTTAEVINKIMVGRYTAPNLLVPNLPPEINEIIIKGLKSDKEERFKNIMEMASALDLFLKDLGFDKSARELEQYSKNRRAFDERLTQLNMPTTLGPRPESGKSRMEKASQDMFSQSTTVSRNEAKAQAEATVPVRPPRAKTSNSRTISPTDTNPPLDNSTKSESADRQATAQPAPPQHTAAPPRHPSAHNPPPKSARSRRAEPRRAIIREVGIFQNGRSNVSTYMIFGLMAAIGLVLIFGGEKLANQLKRDGSRVANQLETLNRKTGNPRPALKAEPKTMAPQATGAVVESQTVVIGPNKTPVVSDKETATFKSGRPVVTTNRTLSVPSRSTRAALQTSTPDSSTRTKIQTVASTSPPVVPDNSPTTSDNRPQIMASVPEKTITSTDRLPIEPPKRGEPGILRVTALPAAEIHIDSKLYGTTNDPEIASQGIRLDSGTYSLRLKRRGYKTEEQQVQIKAGEQKNLSVTLLKGLELIELNIRSNRIPAQIVVEDLKDNGRRKEISMSRSPLTLNLRSSTYRVIVNFGNEVVSRVFELKENEGSQTFTADFK